MRIWFDRSSSTSASWPWSVTGGRPLRELLEPLLLRRELAGHLLVTGLELVADLGELVAELRCQLLQPQAHQLVVAALPLVQPVDPAGQSVDHLAQIGEGRPGRRRVERRLAGRGGHRRLRLRPEVGDLLLELGEGLVGAATEAHGLEGCHQDDPAVPYSLQLAAGWSSLVARRAHNPKVVGSNPTPATNLEREGPGQRPGPSSLFEAFYRIRRSSSGCSSGVPPCRRRPVERVGRGARRCGRRRPACRAGGAGRSAW